MRLKRLKRNLSKNNTFPYFIGNLTNVSYLTGFEGSSAGLIVDKGKVIFITDSRYEEYATSILPGSIELFIQKGNQVETIKEILKGLKCKKLFVEPLMDVAGFRLMRNELKRISIKAAADEVSPLRMTKDEDEIKNIRKAVRIADDCFKHVLKIVKPGMVEWDLSVEIEYFYRKNGCRKTAFDSVVASGNGSSMPHYITSMTKKIMKGDILLIDMGCCYNGYNSDLTRTIFMGNITPEIKNIYHIVKKAQECAIQAVRPGITAGRLDNTARQIIQKEGYGESFGHGLGHGIGLDVHEIPAIKKGNKLKLKKNSVITVEPGIYIPDAGGVRIEDIVLVTEKGHEVLTKSTKEMIFIS